MIRRHKCKITSSFFSQLETFRIKRLFVTEQNWIQCTLFHKLIFELKKVQKRDNHFKSLSSFI